jgi:hypothetical protein
LVLPILYKSFAFIYLFTAHFIVNHIDHSLTCILRFSSLAISVTIICFTELLILFSIIVYHLTFSKLVPLNLSHKGERKVEIYRFLTAIHQTGSKKFHSITFLPHGSADANCYIIYDPKLRDDTKLPKITIFGFKPEYRWTESYPIYWTTPTHKLILLLLQYLFFFFSE